MSAPRFSVVLPTRDRPQRLLAAAESVLEQTFPELELWIVDDASGPETAEACARLAADARVRVVRNEKQKGAAATRNVGIRSAAGDYVAFIDDDCVWHPERLERIQRLLGTRMPTPGYVCTQTVLLSAGPPPRFGLDPVLPAGEPPWRVGTQMIVARRDVLLELDGFDEGLPRAHDWDLAVRLVDRTDWALLPEPLVWAEDLAGLTTDPAKLQRASRVLTRKYGRRSPVSRPLTAAFHGSFAHKLLVLGHWAAGVRHYRLAAILAPRRARTWLLLLAALCGPGAYRGLTGAVGRVRERRS